MVIRDRSAPKENEEIEITPEMIAAGLQILEQSGRMAEGFLSSDALVVRDVFQAMLDRKPKRTGQK